jgi:hypothetical protein
VLEPLLLAAALAVAQLNEPALVAPTPVAPPEDPTQGEEAAVSVPDRDGPGTSDVVSLLEYQVAQVSRADVASGRTTVSVETNAPAPRAGSFPVRFFVDNTSGPAQVITLSVRSALGSGTHVVRRAVEVKAGERRTVNVTVPSELRYGAVSAEGPGIKDSSGGSMVFQATYEPQKVVLALARPEQFERFVGKAPRYSGANVLVHAIPTEEAPAEFAAYLGYDLVVVPSAGLLESLDEAQRLALEGFVASGGHLLVGDRVRSTAMFPLARSLQPGANPYGFGSLVVGGPGAAGTLAPFRDGFPVSPHGALPEYERRYNKDAKRDVLLPQAAAPLGRFLFIIALFTLAIGPGSVWVSRRRGPAALLVTIPGTALITCVLIIGYSLIADGFVVHTSSYGYSLLDSRAHRLVTHGVTAYYANLAPARAQLGPSTMLVAPWMDGREKYVADLTWKDGLTLGGDFVPSRTYREWGFTAVEPTRARLVVKPRGKGWVLQNALGVKVDRVVVNVDGKFFSGGPVRDGGEVDLEAGNTLSYGGTPAASRFSTPVVQAVVHRDLQHREFLARIKDDTLVPTGGVRSTLNSAEHWVRGEFEE